MRKLRRLVSFSIAATLLMTLGAVLCFWYVNWNNPLFYIMFSPKTFTSHDSRLEKIADPMRPIIQNLEDYHVAHGNYPVSLADIGLPDAITATGAQARLSYVPEDDTTGGIIGYWLFSDTWNGALLFEHSSHAHGWFFSVNSEKQPLDL